MPAKTSDTAHRSDRGDASPAFSEGQGDAPGYSLWQLVRYALKLGTTCIR
jgi:hypothetical protein